MQTTIEVAYQIGNEICDDCGPGRDCGLEFQDCGRMDTALDILDRYIKAVIEESSKPDPF